MSALTDLRNADERTIVLRYVQPGLVGLIDGTLSTLAPIFAAALLSGSHAALFVGLATALGAGMLNRCAHECVDQFLQNDLTRHCMRDFDYGGEIQVFDRCPDRARRTGRWLFLSEARI